MLKKHKLSKTYKISSCKKNFLQCVYVIDATCFDGYFFISCDNWKLFFLKVCCYFEIFFNPHIVAFFETSVLKEVCILRYLHNNSAVLLPVLSLTLAKPSQLAYFMINVFYSLFFGCSKLFLLKKLLKKSKPL